MWPFKRKRRLSSEDYFHSFRPQHQPPMASVPFWQFWMRNTR